MSNGIMERYAKWVFCQIKTTLCKSVYIKKNGIVLIICVTQPNFEIKKHPQTRYFSFSKLTKK